MLSGMVDAAIEKAGAFTEGFEVFKHFKNSECFQILKGSLKYIAEP